LVVVLVVLQINLSTPGPMVEAVAEVFIARQVEIRQAVKATVVARVLLQMDKPLCPVAEEVRVNPEQMEVLQLQAQSEEKVVMD
jgi:hypothetical protein